MLIHIFFIVTLINHKGNYSVKFLHSVNFFFICLNKKNIFTKLIVTTNANGNVTYKFI